PLKLFETKTRLSQGSTYLIYWKLLLIGNSWKMAYMGKRPGRRRKPSGPTKKKHWTKPMSISKSLTEVSLSWHVERVRPLILSVLPNMKPTERDSSCSLFPPLHYWVKHCGNGVQMPMSR